MADEQQADVAVEEAPGMDMEAAVADIAESLGQPPEPAEQEEVAGENAAELEDKAIVAEAEKQEPEKVAANSNDIAPDTWRKEAKEAWAAVSPVVKEELRKREADISAYVERVKQPVAVGEKLTEIIKPYLPMYEKTGVDPWQNITAMLQAQERLMFGSPEEKLAMFQSMAKTAGITLEGGQLSAPPDAAMQYVKRLENELREVRSGMQQVTSTVQAARQQELQAKVGEFAQDKAHPHFFAVSDRISHLIRTGAAADLQGAYDLAVMADPVIRQQVVEAEAKQLAEAKATADRERLAKARKPGVALVRSTQRGKPAQAPGSIDDTLEESLAAIKARG